MKTIKIVYWTSTGIFSLMMLFSAFSYFSSQEVIDGFIKMGFPPFFRIELGIAKGIGALVLIFPFIPGRIKEWAYAGFFITFISAFILHVSIHDPVGKCIPPLFALVIMLVSYISYHRLKTKQTAITP